MSRHLCACGILVAVLALGGPAGKAQAADSKDKLPKAKTDPKAAIEKPRESPRDSAAHATRSDRFIDKDNNGVDDRRETRVIRPEHNSAPPTVKKEGPPPPASPPAPKPPPGR